MNQPDLQKEIEQLAPVMTDEELGKTLALLEEKRKKAAERGVISKKTICRALEAGLGEPALVKISELNGQPADLKVTAIGPETLSYLDLRMYHKWISDTNHEWWLDSWYEGPFIAGKSQKEATDFWYSGPHNFAHLRPALILSGLENAGIRAGDRILLGEDHFTVLSPVLALQDKCEAIPFDYGDICLRKKGLLKQWFRRLVKKASDTRKRGA